jgi:hypothetical protein
MIIFACNRYHLSSSLQPMSFAQQLVEHRSWQGQWQYQHHYHCSHYNVRSPYQHQFVLNYFEITG